MLTRFVRIQLAIFAIASVIEVAVMVFVYMQVPTLVGIGRMTVTLELPDSGGLYRFSNVTYRGVRVGTVTEVGLTRAGVRATLSLDASPKIPADLRAEVHSVSAVGEQYVDLLPRTVSPPYLRNGSVIPAADTGVPQPVGPMLDQVSALISSIPEGKLGVLLDETYQGFNGVGYELGSLLDSSATVARDAAGVSERMTTLIQDSAPLLDSQVQTTDSIRRWARSIAGVTEQVAADDAQVRKLLQVGPGTAQEATAMLEQLKPTLPILLANLTTLSQVGVTYHPALEQLLVLLPPAIAGMQSAMPSKNYTGLALGGFHGSVADPPPCTVGFLPPSEWRSPDDETVPDTPSGLYCKLPQDSPLSVRGARNYPCMGHPGKRAPTVEICNSDKPYEPLAMRQHWTGPYPLDPNLVAQGVPIDDRVSFNDYIYGPLEGTPMPAGAAPPTAPGPGPGNQVPLPGPPPPHPPPGQYWPPGNPALPAPPYTDNLPGSPPAAGPGPGNDSAGSAPAAVPSAFDSGSSGGGSAIAVAKYNPNTGTYFGPDGRRYRQSDLITSPEHSRHTWKDLVLGEA